MHYIECANIVNLLLLEEGQKQHDQDYKHSSILANFLECK